MGTLTLSLRAKSNFKPMCYLLTFLAGFLTGLLVFANNPAKLQAFTAKAKELVAKLRRK